MEFQPLPLPKSNTGGGLPFKEPPPSSINLKKPGLNLKPPPKPISLNPIPKAPAPNAGLLFVAIQVFWEIFNAGDVAVADLESLGIAPENYPGYTPENSETVLEEGVSPFTGGQGETYYHVSGKYVDGSRSNYGSERTWWARYQVYGAIEGIVYQPFSGATFTSVQILHNADPGRGGATTTDCLAGTGRQLYSETYNPFLTEVAQPGTVRITSISRVDGQPDTSGNPPPVGQIESTNDWSDTRKPPAQSLNSDSKKNDAISPIPNLIKQPTSGLNLSPEAPQPKPEPEIRIIPSPPLIPIILPGTGVGTGVGTGSGTDLEAPPPVIYRPPFFPYDPGGGIKPPPPVETDGGGSALKPPPALDTRQPETQDSDWFPFPIPVFPPPPPPPPDICKELSLCGDFLQNDETRNQLETCCAEILERIDRRARQTWEQLISDRALTGAILALVIHNAQMVSRRVGITGAQALDAMNAVLSIQTPEGLTSSMYAELSLLGIGGAALPILSAIVGTSSLEDANETWLVNNRVFVAASRHLGRAIEAQHSSALALSEIGNQLFKLRNDLKREGVLSLSNADWYRENANALSFLLRQIATEQPSNYRPLDDIKADPVDPGTLNTLLISYLNSYIAEIEDGIEAVLTAEETVAAEVDGLPLVTEIDTDAGERSE